MRETVNAALAHEAHQIVAGIEGLDLPPSLRATLEETRKRLASILNVTQGERVVAYRWVALAALRVPLDEAARTSEEPRRRLIDRAFLHLNRTLTIDADVRKRWGEAFAQETRCEQLGALHLLSHGIYAFKADASSGRTDLILGEPLSLTDEVRSAEAMVLTEWKCVRTNDAASAKAREGKVQADRYANVELAGFELRRHRYVVLVSEQPVATPASETASEIVLHYVNVVIDPPRPSQVSRAKPQT
jgi:hypothetical protein